MNRTLKEEFGLGKTLQNLQQVKQMVKEVVELYNFNRPHLALQMKTPQQVHQKKYPGMLLQTGMRSIRKIRQLISGRFKV